MNAQGIKKSWSMNKSSLPGPKLKKLILKAGPNVLELGWTEDILDVYYSWVCHRLFE
jgi:hypothetical protein